MLEKRFPGTKHLVSSLNSFDIHELPVLVRGLVH